MALFLLYKQTKLLYNRSNGGTMETIFKINNKINLAYDNKLLLILNNNKIDGNINILWADKSLSSEIIDELVISIIKFYI